MSLTPQITLHVNLLDYSGAQIGSAAQPAYVAIALCASGASLPALPGTAMMGKIVSWPGNIPYTGAAIDIPLFGNDVITPSGTYYSVAILDAGKNVIQAACYQFSGAGTIDLSTAVPYNPFPVITPVTPTVLGGIVTVPFSATPVFNCATIPVVGIITFKMTLTGNVTSATMTNLSPGQLVTFIYIQDGVGSRTVAFPGNVINATDVNSAAGSRTVQTFITETTGNLYPIGPATYN